MMRCHRAPVGWVCTRLADHDGPCAAHPVVTLTPGQMRTLQNAAAARRYRQVRAVGTERTRTVVVQVGWPYIGALVVALCVGILIGLAA